MPDPHPAPACSTPLTSELLAGARADPGRKWAAHALCVGADPDVFFPPADGPASPAQRICGMCPVSGRCLAYSVLADETICCDPGGEPWLRERFEIRDGFLTADGLPSRTARTRQRLGQPLIPGSAWKGIIRSRTEFILRSRYGETSACRQHTGCGHCPVCAVFGHAGQRGLLAFRDSYIEEPIQQLERTQVGIDRVSGGSRQALLFTTEALASGHVLLQIDILGEVPPWVRNVIRHVLRDLDDGLIGAGSRTSRGLGTLKLLDHLDDPVPVTVPELETPQPEPTP